MEVNLIKSESEYEITLKRLEEIFHSEIGTPESDEADLLSLLIKDYENQHHIIEKPDPIRAIKVIIEQRNIKPGEFAKSIGESKDRISKILRYKRSLTLNMIWKINKKYNIPLETLAQEYKLQTKSRELP